jgi:D-beta-D-heptose 7-phosphate kinase / D-beta-D-heptose 1-phosphate adenosyltransferase
MPFHILVVGDYMLDYYYWGRCDRISPEAPVPIVEVQRESHALGGAGNVVKNLLALDIAVDACTVLGEDAVGDLLLANLVEQGVGTQGVLRLPGRKTSIKSRLIAGHQQVIRFDQESREPIHDAVAEQLLARIEDTRERYDAVILSDYAKGLLTPTFSQALIGRARSSQKPVYVDPKGQDFSQYHGATLITPNRKEVARVTGLDLEHGDNLSRAAAQLYHQLALQAVAVTLSEAGIGLYDGEWQVVPTAARDIFDVTGAGDTALAAMAFALLSGSSLREAAHFANAAAAVVISKLGSATATLAEIEEFLAR